LRATLDPERLEAEIEAEMPEDWLRWSPLARAQTIELHSFLSSYLLSCQGDRVAMAHGVEVRYPFLDPEVVAFCCRLPDRFKMLGLRDKLALRRFASRFLPREIWQRPKRPYRAPMTLGLSRTPGASYVDELLSDSGLSRFGLADRRAAALLVAKARRLGGRLESEREEMALVGLLTLQLLAYLYLESFAPRARAARGRLAQAQLYVLVDRSSATEKKIRGATAG
jgi:asparagine synthase (glutamine-hydrolysing)